MKPEPQTSAPRPLPAAHRLAPNIFYGWVVLFGAAEIDTRLDEEEGKLTLACHREVFLSEESLPPHAAYVGLQLLEQAHQLLQVCRQVR